MLDLNHQNACSNEGLLGQYARSLKDMQEAKSESDRQLAHFKEQNAYLKDALEKKVD